MPLLDRLLMSLQTPEMKRLILIRHAKSSQGNASLSDRARPLGERGIYDAPRMGAALRDVVSVPDSVFSSTAVRALSTARLLATALGYDDDAIIAEEALYTFDERALLSAIHAFPEVDKCVALVGHNPACHFLFEQLTGQRLDKYVTCGAAIIDLNVRVWREVGIGTGELVQFLQPKLLS